MRSKRTSRFALRRKGYDTGEVDAYLAAEKAKTDEVQLTLRERVVALDKQCDALRDEVTKLKSREDQIKLAIVAATENADKMSADVKARYRAELDRLQLFRAKWTGAYEQLKERYHFDKDALNMESVAVSTALELQKFLAQDFSLAKGAEADDMEKYFLSEVERLTKQQLETQNSAAFSLEDALHPTESLADICKALGMNPLGQ